MTADDTLIVERRPDGWWYRHVDGSCGATGGGYLTEAICRLYANHHLSLPHPARNKP